jgi:two-component system OmpR family sensor kinase
VKAPAIIERIRERLPVKLKLAVVSAALTFVILLLFAVVVGTFAERRLNTSFEDDLRATAADLQEQIRVSDDGEPVLPPSQYAIATAGGAVIRVFNSDQRLVGGPATPDLGPPIEAAVDIGDYRVISRPLFLGSLRRGESQPFEPLAPPVGESIAGYVQYAKPQSSVESTIAKVRGFLGLGVLGGTALAFLAGFLVARRAMRPIAGLTRAAREVARTRDPAGVELPKPAAHDEVAELADTLEEMLAELGAARAETEGALTRQRAFVADASHELRTPLTSILANLELLEAELQGDQREMAGSALRSSLRMSRLVADLLLLARADAGRRAPRKPVDLAAVVREAVAEATPLAGERTVEVDVPANGAAIVEGGPDDLHRLALNLVENALIHTPVDARVRAAVRAVDGAVELEVVDDGPGIAAEQRERVFDRFSRGGGDVTPPISGSGLGLSIVRAVTEAHGGSVTLDDPPGGGARFRVRLPAAGQAQPAPVTGAVDAARSR